MELVTEIVAPGVTKVNLSGRMDIAGAQSIDLHYNVLVGSERALIIDLSGVEFIASMGLRTLILGARTVASKRGRIVLYKPIPAVEEVLVSSGTDSVVSIVHDLEAALRAVSG
jgi:stage II sporulation protein AA (anti-sigma F factor antagonist)